MSPADDVHGSVRSAAEVLNEQIRDLWMRAGGRLTTEQRGTYAQLVTQWAAAVRRERAAVPGHDETAPALPKEDEGRQDLAA